MLGLFLCNKGSFKQFIIRVQAINIIIQKPIPVVIKNAWGNHILAETLYFYRVNFPRILSELSPNHLTIVNVLTVCSFNIGHKHIRMTVSHINAENFWPQYTELGSLLYAPGFFFKPFSVSFVRITTKDILIRGGRYTINIIDQAFACNLANLNNLLPREVFNYFNKLFFVHYASIIQKNRLHG